MSAQLRLSLQRSPSYARAAFTVSQSNSAATRVLDAWPDWRGGALVLVGPPGSGKTHLAAIWARRVGAQMISPNGPEPEGLDRPILVDDADQHLQGEALFHLINLAAQHGSSLLMTARAPPSQWPADLPDLRSRLNALPVAELLEPDDAVLTAMLAKFFRERSIRPSDELLAYLLRRIERSAVHAQEIVVKLDEAADAAQRPLTRALARQVLEDMSEDDDENADHAQPV
ncbi:AAA family ATPase [Caulobacter sp. S45]|uniref:AAA family ATPase n=1 Tax=Caulobacter sp. S45 TaxID=1641861 RepID=UPI00131D417B|nr:AAA family ATPase [Caulobacter sp. S45]